MVTLPPEIAIEAVLPGDGSPRAMSGMPAQFAVVPSIKTDVGIGGRAELLRDRHQPLAWNGEVDGVGPPGRAVGIEDRLSQ